MREQIIAVVFVLLLVAACTAGDSFAGERWISVGPYRSEQKPKAEVLSSNDSETIIKFTIYGFWRDNAIEDGTTYDMLRFPGYATTTDIGKARLPIISELVAIPASCGVSARVVSYEEETLEGYRMYPYQKALKIGEIRTTFDVDRAFYRSDALYPEIVEIGKPGIWRDLRVAALRIAPIRYSPARGELRVLSSITVRLEYAGDSDINAKNNVPHSVKPQHDAMYRGSVINYESLAIPVVESSVATGYDLLIIAQDEFVDNLAPFVEWKEQIGYSVNLVPLSAVGANHLLIKDYIQNEYGNYGISYCLLVGDGPLEGDLPFYYYDYADRDYPYSLLEGDDIYPDIGVGRFPAASETDVDNMVRKSIAYESNPAQGDWLSKALLIAGPDSLLQEECERIELATGAEDILYYSKYPLEFITAYGADSLLGGDEATEQEVIDCINGGVRVISYFGHGESTNWSPLNIFDEAFDISNVEQLANENLTPIVFAYACETALPISKEAGLGACFVRQDDAAVAYFGATVEISEVCSELITEAYKALFDEGVPTISNATNTAIVRLIALGGVDRINISDDFLWYGDPTLSAIPILSGPSAPELVYPEWGESFDASVQLTFSWTAVGGSGGKSTGYIVQLDDSPDFSSLIIEETLSTNEWIGPMLHVASLYFWRVRAVVNGALGPWSEASHFFVGMPVAAPILISPDDGSEFTFGLRIVLQWSCEYSPAAYAVQVDDDSDFSSPVIDEIVTSASLLIFPESLPIGTPFYWRARAMNIGWPWSDVWSFEIIEYKKTPSPNLASHPNPFNPHTTISFSLPERGHVSLGIYDVAGRLVRVLVDESRDAGNHAEKWDGRDNAGRRVASGVYFYRLEAGAFTETKKMVLLR